MDQLSSVGCEFQPHALERLFHRSVEYYHSQKHQNYIERVKDKGGCRGCCTSKRRRMKPSRWAERTIYESNHPIRPWALHAIRSSGGPLYDLIGRVTRAPGMYKKINPKDGRPTLEFLEDTNERIHPSVRVRLACEGLGPNDSDLWQCPSLLMYWRPRRVAQRFHDPVSRTAKWGPASIRSKATATSGTSLGAQTSTTNVANVSTESLEILGQDPLERWVWEYVGPEHEAPAVRTMVEENLGQFEQHLLELAAGKVHVCKHAEKLDAKEFKAFHHRRFRKMKRRMHKKMGAQNTANAPDEDNSA